MTSNEEKLEELEQKQSENDQFNEPPPPDLVAFNELRSCADLVRMHDELQLKLDPDFQRRQVWKSSEQTRFIDSLVKQLPIPSLCISNDFKTSERQVVDGRQRIASIVRFLSESEWQLSRLDDVDPEISNTTNLSIRAERPEIYSRIQNTTIPVTVLRCDLSKSSHREYLFMIFHRLNAGGTKLNNQEIRNCIYSGPFNELLIQSARNEPFSHLVGKSNDRFQREELILRILALRNDYVNYRDPLSRYLNQFMAKYRMPDVEFLNEVRSTLLRASILIHEQFEGNSGLKIHRLNRATQEALFVGVMRNLVTLSGSNPSSNKEKFLNLVEDELFSTNALLAGVTARDKVVTRIERAIHIFR